MGGLTEGYAIAAMQLIDFDEDGNCIGSNFMDYLSRPRGRRPSFELGETVTPSPHHPLGAKGVGESATVGSPAAYVNAVIDALAHAGVRNIEMPVTSDKVWEALERGGPRRVTSRDPDGRRPRRGRPARRRGASRSRSPPSSRAAARVGAARRPRRRDRGRAARRLGRRRVLRARRRPRGAAGAGGRRAAALRICPPGIAVDEDGVVVAESSCASEGTVEVLIEPQLPAFRCSRSSARARPRRRSRARRGDRLARDERPGAGADAVVVATMGRGDAEAARGGARDARRLRRPRREREACRRSSSRGCASAGSTRRRSRACGARPGSISARSSRRRSRSRSWPRSSRGGTTVTRGHRLPVEAIDPVCGMTVAVVADTPSAEHEGVTYWFCCPGCRGRFVREPERFLAAESA